METQSQYPPVSQNQMPQWSRVGHLDKSRYPKAFIRDEFTASEAVDGEYDVSLGGVDRLDDQNPAIRVEYLERSIRFLKAQHQDILSSLHTEIEKLRNDNKELHFKLIMKHRGQEADEHISDEEDEVDGKSKEEGVIDSYVREKSNERATTRAVSGSAKSRTKLLERQITELRHQVRELKNKNEYLTQLVDNQLGDTAAGATANTRSNHDARSSASGSELSINMAKVVHSQQARSVVVHDRMGSARRRPNPSELEKIVNHLHRTNLQQERELAKVKSDLKEVLYSQKWTPDAYLLAKAYVASDGAPDETDILPKLQMRSTTRKLPDIAYISRDNVSLPALKNTMGTKAAERRKRTQILQRARLHKEVS